MRSKRLAVVAVVAGALVVPSAAYGDPPAHAGPPDDIPANCLGAWRHLQNSAGGEWAHGVFGKIHVATVHAVVAQGMPFGQWLAQWKEQNC